MTEETKPKRVRNTTGVKRRPGQPSVLSEAVQAEFFANRAWGISIEKSAELAGVSWTSVKNWRAVGEESLSIPAGKRTPYQQKCVTFFTALRRVDSEWVKRCEIVLNLAMSPASGDRWQHASAEEKRLAVQAATFKLTHQASHDYSTRSEISGPDGGPMEVQASGGDVYEQLVRIKEAERGSE